MESARRPTARVAFEMTGTRRAASAHGTDGTDDRDADPSPTWSTSTRRAGRPTADAGAWWRRGGGATSTSWTRRADHALTDDRAYDLEPRFSPDGKLPTSSATHRRLQPVRLRIRDQEDLPATNVVDGVFDPAISPDGKTVAFVGFRAHGYDLGRPPRSTVDLARRPPSSSIVLTPPPPRSRGGRPAGTTRSARSIRSPEAVRHARRLRRDHRRAAQRPDVVGATRGACSSASAPAAATTCSSPPTTPTRVVAVAQHGHRAR